MKVSHIRDRVRRLDGDRSYETPPRPRHFSNLRTSPAAGPFSPKSPYRPNRHRQTQERSLGHRDSLIRGHMRTNLRLVASGVIWLSKRSRTDSSSWEASTRVEEFRPGFQTATYHQVRQGPWLGARLQLLCGAMRWPSIEILRAVALTRSTPTRVRNRRMI